MTESRSPTTTARPHQQQECGQYYRAERVDVLQRIERDPAPHARSHVVSQETRRNASGTFTKGDGDHPNSHVDAK
jgi:hypothetical protein